MRFWRRGGRPPGRQRIGPQSPWATGIAAGWTQRKRNGMLPYVIIVGIKPSDYCAAGVKVPFCTKCGQSTMKRASARCTTRKIIGRSRCYFDFVHFTILKLRGDAHFLCSKQLYHPTYMRVLFYDQSSTHIFYFIGCMVFDYLRLLALFQILRYLSFSRYIALTMYLDIIYIQVHSKTYISRIKKNYISSEMEGLFINA